MKATLAMWGRSVAIGLLWAGLQSGVVRAKDQVRGEFHQTYPLTANGQVRLDNVNGKVQITTWDRAEVKVDAFKRAEKQEHLDALKIEIDSKSDRIRIHTHYPDSKSGWRWKNDSASVDYEIKVPAQARLEDVQTVNGSLEIEGVRGAVHASTVNGRLGVKGLAANADLTSVNGTVEAAFDRIEGVKSVALKTVNGKVELTLPANADADVSANTVNGSIHTDHDLTVKKNWPLGSELHGKLGKGGTRIKAETVNGAIQIRRP
jgi:hypothetical protein